MELNVWLITGIWMGLALVASIISIKIGLTFGTISALFGLTNKIIDRTQYTILVTVVIGSAIIPTIIAQRFFHPESPATESTEEAIETISVPENGSLAPAQ